MPQEILYYCFRQSITNYVLSSHRMLEPSLDKPEVAILWTCWANLGSSRLYSDAAKQLGKSDKVENMCKYILVVLFFQDNPFILKIVIPGCASLCLVLALIMDRKLPCRPLILPLGMFVSAPPVAILAIGFHLPFSFFAPLTLTMIYVGFVIVSTSIGFNDRPGPNVYIAQTIAYIWIGLGLCCTIYGLNSLWDEHSKEIVPQVMLFVLGASNVVLYVAAFRARSKEFANTTRLVMWVTILVVFTGLLPGFLVETNIIVNVYGFFQIVALSFIRHCLKHIKLNDQEEEIPGETELVPVLENGALVNQQLQTPATPPGPDGLQVDNPPRYPGLPELSPAPTTDNSAQQGPLLNPPEYSTGLPPTYSQVVEGQEENEDEISEAPSYASILPPGHLRIQDNI